eukprot:COSAG01_NODE_70666_length_258_cov_0.635220_1_plen_45_part_10
MTDEKAEAQAEAISSLRARCDELQVLLTEAQQGLEAALQQQTQAH